jgi:IS5 family transposase
MPIRVFITSGATADCAQAEPLIAGLDAQYLPADKGYDSGTIVNQALARDIVPVIPPRKKPQGSTRLRQSALSAPAFDRKRFLAPQAVARYRHSVRQEYRLISGGCSYSVYCFVGRYLMTTL